MIQALGKLITYEYIDCVSKSSSRHIRVVKVQHTEFLWPTETGDWPPDSEVHLRKTAFIAQLEQQFSTSNRHIHVLYLRHQYSNFWGDVIEPLFVVDSVAWTWNPATMAL